MTTNTKKGNLRAVVLTGGGLIVPLIIEDCYSAMIRAGIEAFKVRILTSSDIPDSAMKDEVRAAISGIKPDFILSVDCGHVRDRPEFFADLGCPVVAWFVDDPTMVMTPEKAFDSLYVFIWDQEYIEPMRRMGYKRVEYLPLATNPLRFRRMARNDPAVTDYRCDISFVGSSLHHAPRFTETVGDDNPGLRELLEECVEIHAAPPHPPVAALLEYLERRRIISISTTKRRILEDNIALEAMMLYRSRAVNRPARLMPHVYGDDGWKSLLAQGTVFRGAIDYSSDLSLLYNASKINLNISKSQLKTSVTQRVFDAPACGGFVLSDYREDVERLFDPDTEIAVFHSLDELESKAKYFLENDAERESRARLARRRVLSEHTYSHRIKTVLDTLALNA